MRTFIRATLMVGFVAAGSAACATTQAKAPVERAPLEVPPVPPRVIESLPQPPLPPPEPVGPLPTAPPANNSRPRPQPQRDATKGDPKGDVPPVEAPAAPVLPPQQSVPPLRTPGTPEAAEATKQIRDVNGRAQAMLDTIDYRVLDAERRAQYDNVKMFISQAEDAIKAANFEFGRNMAEKAERLAKELRSRYATIK